MNEISVGMRLKKNNIEYLVMNITLLYVVLRSERQSIPQDWAWYLDAFNTAGFELKQ